MKKVKTQIMFNKLYNLFGSTNQGRKPLEDFNTEILAGILVMYPKIKEDYATNFLELPTDRYKVKTQVYVPLPDDMNCYIDLVFEGKENLCYVENKVESGEGYKQIARNLKALQIETAEGINKNMILHYCTKYYSSKEKNNLINYTFKQYQWFEVAKFLRKYKDENPIVKSYLNFLKTYEMENDNKFKPENIIAMEAYKQTIAIAQNYIKLLEKDFNQFFGPIGSIKDLSWKQLRQHNRVCLYKLNILGDGYSELMYSINFKEQELNTMIYIGENNSELKRLKLLNISKNMELYQSDDDAKIIMNNSILNYLNDENYEFNIRKWFIDSFKEFRDLILSNDEFDWNDEIDSFLKKEL